MTTAGGSALNTLPQNMDGTIMTNDHDKTISASGNQPALPTAHSEPMNIHDESQPLQAPEPIPEEDDQRATGSNFGKTTQTRFVDASQKALSNAQNEPSDHGRQSKKSSHRSSQQSKQKSSSNKMDQSQ